VDFLASVIPGFRTLRTPVIAGVLWILDVSILLISDHVHFRIKHSTIVAANTLFPNWAGIVALPIVLAAAYLLGSVMISLAHPVLEKIIDVYRWTLTRIARPYQINMRSRFREPGKYPWRKRIDRLARRSYPISMNAHGLLYDYVISVLTNAGATGTAAVMFPVESLYEDLIQCAAQLSQVNSTQYQEYDRIQAESEFRLAVVPPLIVGSFLVPISLRWLLIFGIGVSSLILLTQSVSLNRRANDMLASAARLGYLEIPDMKSLSSFLANISPPPDSDGAWIGAIIVGLNRRGLFEEADVLIRESTELDQESVVASLMRYLDSSDGDIAEQFRREFLRLRGVEVHKFKGTGV
jgi:hypothetical protein